MEKGTFWSRVSIWMRKHGINTLLMAGTYVVIGFMAGRAYLADEMKKKADDDHQASLKQISSNVETSLKPLKEDIKTDLKDAMLLCTEAAFRSIRAANTATKASESASSAFDEQKRALKEELDK